MEEEKTENNRTEPPARGWFNKQAMAEMLDVTEQHFDRSFRPLAPAQAVKTVNRRVYFHARTFLDAWLASLSKPTKPEISPDPLLAGPESDALEDFRKARAAQEWIRLAEMEGKMVPRAELDPALAKLASRLRDAGETLQRHFGPEAAAILNEAIDDIEAAWVAELKPKDDDDGNDAVGSQVPK